VLADGTTTNVHVIDVVPPRFSTKETIAAVNHWKFTPAMEGGRAIDWHNNEWAVVFADPNTPLDPTPAFMQTYQEAAALLQAKKYDQAKAANEQLLSTVTARLHEIGLAETQSALVSLGLADPRRAYDAIRRATDPAVVTLLDDELRQVLQIRFGIEIALGRVVDALDTFARLGKFATPPDEKTTAQAKAIAEALKSDAAIRVDGRVDGDPWIHVPSRRTFTLANIEGQVREIRLECDRKGQVLPYAADVDWTLPPGWGACTILVDAQKNTSFKLYEFK